MLCLILTMWFPPSYLCSPHNFLVCHYLPLISLFFMLSSIPCIFFNNVGVHYSLGLVSNHESIYRKGFLMGSWRTILLSHVKLNGKLDFQALLVVCFVPLLLCYRLYSAFIYCPLLSYPFILYQLIPQVNIFWVFCEPYLGLLVLSYHPPIWDHDAQFLT